MLGLARALATDPDILLMDEAFSALDPLIRSQMQDELMEIQDKLHKTILFVTHDLNEALRVGTRVMHHEGRSHPPDRHTTGHPPTPRDPVRG